MLEILSEAEPDFETARRQAREAAEAGRFREAVAIGKLVNRKAPDLAFAGELRDWRHRAYYEAKPVAGTAQWPPSYADPFPDLVNQLPEIDASELTLDILGGAIEHHGTLIIRGLFSREQMNVYVDAILKTFSQLEEEGQEAAGDYHELKPVAGSLFELIVSRTLFPGVTIDMADAPNVMELWFAGLEQSGIIDLVTNYLDEHPAIAACKADIFRMPPMTEPAGWHQDGAAFGKDCRAINIWVAATECGEKASGLEFVPTRLTDYVETGTKGTDFYWSVGESVAEAAATMPLVRPNFMPGDAVMFDKFSLHRATALPGMNKPRYALQSWLFAPSKYTPRVPGGESPMIWI
jgi:hypothetical protein